MNKEKWGVLHSLNPLCTHVALFDETANIGRRPNNTIVLTDPQISGLHCTLMRLDDVKGQYSVLVRDHSLNGTFIDGKRMPSHGQQVLRDGAQISLVKNTDRAFSFIFKASRPTSPEDGAKQKSRWSQHEKSNQYHICEDRVLGTGAFSTVYLGYILHSREQVAFKCINKAAHFNNYKSREQIVREMKILKELDHPNIIKLYDILDDAENVYMVLEIAKGGDLFSSIAKRTSYTEEDARNVIRQILQALSYLHARDIAHRDLKPENILLADGPSLQVKLTDFGLARIVPPTEMMTTLCGTPQYVAPEVISSYMASQQTTSQAISRPRVSRRKSERVAINPSESVQKGANGAGYGKEVDMWSVGVLMYVLLSGYSPFDSDDNTTSLFSQIQNGQYEFTPHDVWVEVSVQAKDLIEGLMEVDPARRLTVEQALQHDWIKGRKFRSFLNDVPTNIKRKPPLAVFSPQKLVYGGGNKSDLSIDGMENEAQSANMDVELLPRAGQRKSKRPTESLVREGFEAMDLSTGNSFGPGDVDRAISKRRRLEHDSLPMLIDTSH